MFGDFIGRNEVCLNLRASFGMGWDDVSLDHGADFDDRFSDYDYGGEPEIPDYDDY